MIFNLTGQAVAFKERRDGKNKIFVAAGVDAVLALALYAAKDVGNKCLSYKTGRSPEGGMGGGGMG